MGEEQKNNLTLNTLKNEIKNTLEKDMKKQTKNIVWLRTENTTGKKWYLKNLR